MILLYRAISWIASIVIAFSNVGALAEAPNTPAWDNDAYQSSMAKGALRFSPKWDITFDDVLTEAFGDLEQRTGFSVPEAVSGLKDMFWTHRWMVKLFPGVFYGLRDRWLDKGDEWERNGDGSRMVLYRLLGICVGMPTKAKIVAVPMYEDHFEIFIDCTYADGSVRRLKTYSEYDRITGEFGEDNGVGGLSYNFNFNDAMAYTTNNSWQRGLGYMKLYDTLLLQTTKMVNIDTVRLKFDYQGMDWMLQLWKGRYFTTTGGEIGLYHKPKDRLINFYDAVSDDERLYMSFTITTDDTAIAEPVIIDRPVMLRWWFTGFAVREFLYTPDRLTLGTVVVPADTEMYNALKGALDGENVPYDEITWGGCDDNGWVECPALEITWK